MASTDSDSFAAALQEYYTTENIVDMTYEENPRHALFPKKTDCSGKYYVQPVQYGGTKGRSRSFSTAQSLKDGGEYVDFIVPWRDDYALHSIKRKVMKQSVGDASFFEAQTREFDDILKRLVRSAALSEYRGYGGAMGQINSSYSSGTEITLSDPDEITNFELGDVLQLSAGDGNTSTDTLIAGVERTITAIDVDDGKITFDSATGLAASRYLFKKGDFQKSFNGFLDWCPLTAPSSTAFLGVDRSVHSHLGGNRIDKTGSNIKEAVLAGLTRVRRQGGKTTHVWMNTSVRERLVYHARLDEYLSTRASRIRARRRSPIPRDGSAKCHGWL